jgi:hypothetical protein
MLSLSAVSIVSSEKILLVRGNAEEQLSSRMGERFGFILSYSWIDLFSGYKIVIPEKYILDNSKIAVIAGANEKEKFSEILIKFSKFKYLDYQSDPNKLFTEGGNCQAIALYLMETFNKNGFENGLILEPDHMHNWVKVGGIKYKVDLVRKTVEEV